MARDQESYAEMTFSGPRVPGKCMPVERICLQPFQTIYPISLRSPVVMSGKELAAWSGVGRNAVPMLATRFRIRELTGNAKNHRFSVHDVLRKIIGTSPETPEDLERLLMPLQKAAWVSKVTGMSTSAISAGICENRSSLPVPVELTVTGQGQAPARGRRWLPAQIDAYLHGDPIPFLAHQTSLRDVAENRAQQPAGNVFAAICADSAGSSP